MVMELNSLNAYSVHFKKKSERSDSILRHSIFFGSAVRFLTL
jgi:hypothetical protein